MGRMIDLDQEVGFSELKESIKFYGKKWYVNKDTKLFLDIKILEKKYKTERTNLIKNKTEKNAEKLLELADKHNYDMLKTIFGVEQAKEMMELRLNERQLNYIIQAVMSIIDEKDFVANPTEAELEEKKTNSESADMTS